MKTTTTLATDDGKIVRIHPDDPRIFPTIRVESKLHGEEFFDIYAHRARSGKAYFYITPMAGYGKRIVSKGESKESWIPIECRLIPENVVIDLITSAFDSGEYDQTGLIGVDKDQMSYYMRVMRDYNILLPETA